MYEIIDFCEEQKNYSHLIRTLGAVYSSIESLAQSFLQVEDSSPIATALDEAGGTQVVPSFTISILSKMPYFR